LAHQLLRREAETLVEGSSPADPVEHLRRGRIYARLGEEDKSGKEFDAAVTIRPNEARTWAHRGRIYAELGAREKADADFAKAIALAPDDAAPWIARGRSFAQRGETEKADADFIKAAALTGTQLQRFLDAGWWVVGPYPEALATCCPPEKSPDPSRPVARLSTPDTGEDQEEADLKWRTIPTHNYGYVNLGPPFDGAEHLSVYALNYVYAPEERSATLMVGGDDFVRVWLNGRLVHEIPSYRYGYAFSLDRVPVTLRAGRNTLLVKVSNVTRDHYFHLRLADNPSDQAFTRAELGLWDEAAALLAEVFKGKPPTNTQLWHRQAALLLLSGDTEGYCRHCAALLKRYGAATDATQAYSTALACNLAPAPGRDTSVVLRQAERALKARPNQAGELFEVAVARHRAGQQERAIKTLSDSAELLKLPKTWAVLALAHHGLGHAEDAKKWLAKGDEWHDKAVRDALAAPAFQRPQEGPIWEYAQFLIYQREAKTLIEGAAPKDDANVKALQDRARDWLKQRPATTADYDLAILLSPRSERAWLSRGRMHAESGQLDKAADDFAQALTLGKGAGSPWWTERAIDEELAQRDEVFDRVVKLRPGDALPWVARASYHARRGQWQDAAAATARVLELDASDHMSWYSEAVLRLQLGDVEGYRRACRQMLERFGQTKEAYVADRTAKTCLLMPDAVDDLKPVVRLAEQAVTGTEKNTDYGWFLLARGMAHYRTGEFAAAVERLRNALNPDAEVIYRDAAVHLFLAMAQHRLGQAGEARAALAKAQALMDEKFPRPGRDVLGANWGDWLRCQLFRREAEELLEEKGADKGN
jgi:tetratricopeptide (TPR) repeat protein